MDVDFTRLLLDEGRYISTAGSGASNTLTLLHLMQETVSKRAQQSRACRGEMQKKREAIVLGKVDAYPMVIKLYLLFSALVTVCRMWDNVLRMEQRPCS